MLLRARMVQDMTAKHYEAGRQDRCKRWVYMHIVSKALPMSERTFFRYLAMDISGLEEPAQRQEDKRQLKLF
jgi:hypothetical protein